MNELASHIDAENVRIRLFSVAQEFRVQIKDMDAREVVALNAFARLSDALACFRRCVRYSSHE